MENDFIIREYREADKHQILELLNRNFQDQQHLNIERNLKWWDWKYKNNIYGEPIINVIEYNSKIIACRPFWPWKLNVRGTELRCYQPVDAVVDKEFRGKGFFSKLTTKTLLENQDRIDLIFNFSNDQSIGANIRAGWTYVGKLQWYVKVNKIFNSYKQIVNSTGYKSKMLDTEDSITLNKINAIRQHCEFSGKLKAIRSKEFLEWRYLKHPQINYGMRIIEINNKQLIYVFEINSNSFGSELLVIDYFGNIELFNYMLNELDLIVKKYNVSFISLIKKYNTPTSQLMKKMYLKQHRKNLLVLPLRLDIEQISINYDNWDMFLGLHDSI